MNKASLAALAATNISLENILDGLTDAVVMVNVKNQIGRKGRKTRGKGVCGSTSSMTPGSINTANRAARGSLGVEDSRRRARGRPATAKGIIGKRKSRGAAQ